MNKIIYLNYQREIPPYLISEINFSKKKYDFVYYITPQLHNDNSNLIKSDNVNVIQCSKFIWVLSLFKVFGIIFNKEIKDDIRKAKKENKLNKNFLIHIVKEIVCSNVLYYYAKKIIRKDKCSPIIVLSSWFDTEAYAASKLKKKFKNIKAYSFAHAFEINQEVNDYVDLSLNEFKHKYLDGIYFISEVMRNKYNNTTKNLFSNYYNKEHIRYLGSIKYHDKINKLIDNEFNIVSCASVVDLKRLDIILDSLYLINDYNVTWTHIGDGPLLNDLKEKAKTIENEKENIHIRFVGKLTNYEVQKYYADNSIDLFISVSRSEGLPVSIMEALSYGIPVIATNAGGTSELVNDNVGKLIPIDIGPNDLSKYITDFKNLGEEEKQVMRNKAFLQWKKSFDLYINSMEFYDELCN